MNEQNADVVSTESGKQVRMSYQRGCHEYTIGVANAFFMASTLLGFVILWRQHIPEAIYTTSVAFFVVFSASGFCLIAVAYTRPVLFYETLEGER